MLEALLIISVLLFAFGAVIGSFLNVVIYRSVNEESWVTGRSQCEHCHKKIAWYDNIPIVSFLWLGGKCRVCKKPIALTHPVIEFLTGMLFVWWYLVGSLFFQLSQKPFQTLQPLFWLLVGLLLLVVFFADFLYLIIPDFIVSLLMVLVVGYRLLLVTFGIMQMNDLLMAGLGMVLSVTLFGGLWLATRGRGMGFGDVKLSVPIALLVGWPNVIISIFLSFILGALVGVVLIGSGKRKFSQVIPFGPFMVLGTLISLIWGDQLVQWYMGLL